MKHRFIQTVKILLAAIVLSFGVSYVYAVWQGPTQAPPDGNISSPINVGTTAQSKEGSLAIGSSDAPVVTLDVAGNIGAGNAVFSGDVDAGTFTLGGVSISSWPNVVLDMRIIRGPSSTGGSTATCPVGYTITGGGYDLGAPDESYPTGNSWYTKSASPRSSTRSYAVCIRII